MPNFTLFGQNASKFDQVRFKMMSVSYSGTAEEFTCTWKLLILLWICILKVFWNLKFITGKINLKFSHQKLFELRFLTIQGPISRWHGANTKTRAPYDCLKVFSETLLDNVHLGDIWDEQKG